MPTVLAGKLLAAILTGVAVFTGDDGAVEEFVPELHPLANESDKIRAKINARENVFAFGVPCAELMRRLVNLVMKLLIESGRQMLLGYRCKRPDPADQYFSFS
jgi:hypothetical protein